MEILAALFALASLLGLIIALLGLVYPAALKSPKTGSVPSRKAAFGCGIALFFTCIMIAGLLAPEVADESAKEAARVPAPAKIKEPESPKQPPAPQNVRIGALRATDIQFASGFDPADKEVVMEAWPKVVRACPGITTYRRDLVFKPAESNYHLDVIFEVPDGKLPRRFVADGHTCFLSIAHDGRTLSIAKDACKAVCLGREVRENEETDDLLINL